MEDFRVRPNTKNAKKEFKSIMRLSEKVRNWEFENDRRRAERENADRLRTISERKRTEQRFRELLGSHLDAMMDEGIEWDVENGRVNLRANGRVMVLHPARVGQWIQWGMLTFPVRNDEEVFEFFSTVFSTLRVGGVS